MLRRAAAHRGAECDVKSLSCAHTDCNCCAAGCELTESVQLLRCPTLSRFDFGTPRADDQHESKFFVHLLPRHPRHPALRRRFTGANRPGSPAYLAPNCSGPAAALTHKLVKFAVHNPFCLGRLQWTLACHAQCIARACRSADQVRHCNQ